MPELRWRLDVGGELSEGTRRLERGVNRLRPESPAGIIGSVTAVLDMPLSRDGRVFMNGYQTWTYSPEYSVRDRQRGLRRVPSFIVDKFSLDRYGDCRFYDYTEGRGRFHGYSYCYFREGDVFRLLASLDERQGYTVFEYDAEAEVLTVSRDCSGVRHGGGEISAFDLYYAEGTEDEVFDGWFAAMKCVPRTREKIAGYSSWYNRYEKISESSVLTDLDGCSGILSEGDLFQIDDGWEKHVGDWLSPDAAKFPNGMKTLSDRAHGMGLLSGLWLAPFAAAEGSELLKEHPDWLLRENGTPWRGGSNWGGFYALDIDVPQVREYLKRVFDRVLKDWGFDLVKLDFLYAAAPFGTERESRAGRMYRALGLLREWCGDKLILGCGVPVMPAFGIVDYCRVGCDVSLEWDGEWFTRPLHSERTSTRRSITDTVFRRQLNGRAYGSDPDVFFLRDENLRLTPEQKERLYTANALFGSVLLTSDDPSRYSAEQKERYRSLLRLREAKNLRVSAENGITVSYTLGEERHTLRLTEK